MSSSDDFLVADEDIVRLEAPLGADNVFMDDRGGRMGNLWTPRVRQELLDAPNDLAGDAAPGDERG